MNKRKAGYIAAAAAVAVCLLAVVLYQRTVTFSQLLPLKFSEIAACEVVMEPGGEAQSWDLDADRTEQLLQCMEGLSYQRDGRGSAVQDCYARIFLTDDESDRWELMLTPSTVLVNHIGAKGRSPKYSVLPDSGAVRTFLQGLTEPAA